MLLGIRLRRRMLTQIQTWKQKEIALDQRGTPL